MGPACWLKKKKSIQAYETKCLRKLLRISYLELKTNDWVSSTISFCVGPLEPQMATVKRRKLAWFGTCHTLRQPDNHHPAGHLEGWATPWSAEEMLNGQHQGVDIPAHARTDHQGLLQKRLDEEFY